MAEPIVQQVLPAPLDPDTWYRAEQIREARPWATDAWLKSRREAGTLPYAKTGKTAGCMYRLRDIDALLDTQVVPATSGPLAQRAE